MYTRASSIRSNYTTTSTKTKSLISQRNIAGNEALQHYNSLQIADTSAIKNNNIMNGNHNWTVKSSWPFKQPSMVANGTVVEWQDKKCVCFPKIYCKANDHPSCTTTTMAKAASIPLSIQNNKNNTLIEPLANNVNSGTSMYTHETAKNCCRCHDRKSMCKENIFDQERCCAPNATVEWEQMRLCAPKITANKCKSDIDGQDNDEDDDNDIGADIDFAREIIRINNIYNNCNANVNSNANANANANCTNGDESLKPATDFHLHGFNSSCISMRKYKNDISL